MLLIIMYADRYVMPKAVCGDVKSIVMLKRLIFSLDEAHVCDSDVWNALKKLLICGSSGLCDQQTCQLIVGILTCAVPHKIL